MSALSFRKGRAGDIRATFELGEFAWDASRIERNLLPADHERDADELGAQWSASGRCSSSSMPSPEAVM